MDYTLFFRELDDLPQTSRAILKKCAGKMLSESDGKAMTIFYNCLNQDIEQWQEDIWFACACFHCSERGDVHRIPIENAIQQKIRSEGESKIIEHRLEQLCDDKWDKDGHFLLRLYKFFRMLQQDGYCIDCALLLDDLIHWDDDDQSVQHKWIQKIFAPTEIDAPE